MQAPDLHGLYYLFTRWGFVEGEQHLCWEIEVRSLFKACNVIIISVILDIFLRFLFFFSCLGKDLISWEPSSQSSMGSHHIREPRSQKVAPQG